MQCRKFGDTRIFLLKNRSASATRLREVPELSALHIRGTCSHFNPKIRIIYSHHFMAKDILKKSKPKEKKPAKKERAKAEDRESYLTIEARNSIFAIACFVVVLVFVLAPFGIAGPAGDVLYSAFNSLFGIGYYLVPVLALILGISLLKEERPELAITHSIGSLLFLASGLALVDAASIDVHYGGIIGQAVFWPFMRLFGIYAGIIFVGGLLIISILVLFNDKPDWAGMGARIRMFFSKERALEQPADEEDEDEEIAEEISEEIEDDEEESVPVSIPVISASVQDSGETKEDDFILEKKKPLKPYVSHEYTPPPLSLLATDKGKPGTGDIKANSNIIKRTLQNFGIEVEMDEITVGPSITRYALKPAQGVKLSRITGLSSDLALALSAKTIRIEAPIPGKSLVGIEIPNKEKSMVGLASLLADDKFTHAEKPLMVALGRNVSGTSIIANLAKMPHALIAGATGSGKSVTIHTIITSLLYKNGPDDLRFIFIDPKRVELTLYNKIPHLLTPVITDPKKAILALKWAAKEMDRRYNLLEQNTSRDIESYNKKRGKDEDQKEGGLEKLPYIVIIIDELADIMQTYPRELESGIVRLAQMSRAVGIHLILSTQRPSVNVVTGLIKANIPARVALQVASQIDSRTILDTPGAEKLLGAGDMLYSSGEMSSPERLQSAFISEDEVKKVVKFLVDNYADEIQNELNLTGSNISADKSIFEASIMDEGDAPDDDMYEEARQIVIDTQKASTSFLQRKLGIGYARAARLIDMLEEHGIVSAGNGAKPREVLEKPVDNIG
jgi:S-DNA-T family DNA segregation ATPase FtsK/SpoIIIE